MCPYRQGGSIPEHGKTARPAEPPTPRGSIVCGRSPRSYKCIADRESARRRSASNKRAWSVEVGVVRPTTGVSQDTHSDCGKQGLSKDRGACSNSGGFMRIESLAGPTHEPCDCQSSEIFLEDLRHISRGGPDVGLVQLEGLATSESGRFRGIGGVTPIFILESSQQVLKLGCHLS